MAASINLCTLKYAYHHTVFSRSFLKAFAHQVHIFVCFCLIRHLINIKTVKNIEVSILLFCGIDTLKPVSTYNAILIKIKNFMHSVLCQCFPVVVKMTLIVNISQGIASNLEIPVS